jgi:type IV secretory pathway VirB2 component (pilin)
MSRIRRWFCRNEWAEHLLIVVGIGLLFSPIFWTMTGDCR